MQLTGTDVIQEKLALMADMQQRFINTLGPSVFPTEKVAMQEWKTCVTQLKREEFCFTVDISSMTFPMEMNTDTFFGQRLLSVPNFLSRIHPEFLDYYLRWGAAAYSMAMDPQHRSKVAGRRTTYRILIPLLFLPFPGTADSARYYWVVQSTRPYRLDENNLMTEQLNTYRVFKRFEENDLTIFKAEICYDDGLVTEAETQSMVNHLYQNMLNDLGEEASAIIRSYVNGNNNSEEVAQALGISPNRVKTVQKAILKSANSWYPWKKFTMAKQFAQFLLGTLS